MEYVQGPTLSNLLHLDGTIPQHLAVEYAAQIAEALDAAYRERNVIHRDIKPENLMLNRWGKVKVMDFGLARALGHQKITVAKTLVGSIYYASPEQVWGRILIIAAIFMRLVSSSMKWLPGSGHLRDVPCLN